MDDTAQNQTNNIQPQATPVGATNKEVAPVSNYVRASEAAVIMDREVSDAGIVEVEKEIKLEEAHEKMGVRVEPAPVKTEPMGLVQLPMDEQATEAQIKKGPGHNINIEKFFEGIFFADSVYGFAVLMAKHLKRIHLRITGQPV